MVKCKDCNYSIKKEGKRVCKRFPPVCRLANPSGSGYENINPIVDNNDSCGEGIVRIEQEVE